MAIAKVILNGETLMDVTSDTPSASNMLNGIIATKNDGTKVTGNITNKSSTDLTVSGATVTAPAGYYANAASKAVSTTTHPNPSASITSSTGVVTASHTQTTGYVTSGTTTGTLNLTTQAAQTIYPSTADQTIASYRWLTGTQTIKSVTTSNLTAANIAEGVVVKVGDANNASRITQITGTHSGAISYTATISGSGNSNYCYVTYSGTKYYSDNGTFTFKAGDTLTIYCRGNNVTINGTTVFLSNYSYTYTLPVGDITINLSYSSSTSNNIKIYGLVKPTGSLDIDNSGTFDVYGVSQVTVPAGSAFPPAVTITINPAFSINSATGVVTASYSGGSIVTPTISSGYIRTGTEGNISTTGTNTYQLTTQAAQTIYPSKTDQVISSYRWLTGSQIIKGDANLLSSNIIAGKSIFGVEGTYDVVQEAKQIAERQNYTYNSSTGIYMQALSLASRIGSGAYYGVNFLYKSSVSLPLVSSIFQAGFFRASYLASVYAPVCYVIDDSAFYSCFSLKSVDFPICTDIRNSAFYGCSSLQDISFPSCTSIYYHAFAICGLISINFPKCLSIGASAFYNCSRLTTANFSVCTFIDTAAFWVCSSLASISFPACLSIEQSAFNMCLSLTNISFPQCSIIGMYAFQSCSRLTSIYFPQCSTISGYAFANCTALTTISFSACTSIRQSVFNGCSGLTNVSLPICEYIGSYAFNGCIALTTISLPACTTINSGAFRSCYNLLSVYLLNSTVVSLVNINVFTSTPISTYTTSTGGVRGTIYVPSSLYNTYITATNWTTYSSRIVSM